MKKLTNKKGFTLIEMLVVIAIIAVLVAIIIPTISSATTKAAAATDAANMRSLKALITTSYLSDGVGTGKNITEIKNDGTVVIKADLYPAMKDFTSSDNVAIPKGTAKNAAGWAITFDASTKAFTVTYGNDTTKKDIAGFALAAETGSFTPAS